MWVDGPRRSPADVDSGLRETVREMVLRSYVLQKDAWEGAGHLPSLERPDVVNALLLDFLG